MIATCLGISLSLEVTLTKMILFMHMNKLFASRSDVPPVHPPSLRTPYIPCTIATFAKPELSTISTEQRQAHAQAQNDVQAQLCVPHGSTQMTADVINHVFELEHVILDSVRGEGLDLATPVRPGIAPRKVPQGVSPGAVPWKAPPAVCPYATTQKVLLEA